MQVLKFGRRGYTGTDGSFVVAPPLVRRARRVLACMQPKVLVVDDEANVRQILLFVLAPVSETLEASNGYDALRIIRNEKPSLVLLDVMMPEMSGLAVLKAALEISPALHVVMLTGESDLGIVRHALDAGACAYMTKPFDPKMLRAEVGRLLEDIKAPRADYRPWRVAAY